MISGFGVGVGVGVSDGAGSGTVRFDAILSLLILKLVLLCDDGINHKFTSWCRSTIDTVIPTGPLQCCELLVWEVLLMRKGVNNEELDALANHEANGTKVHNLGRSESEFQRWGGVGFIFSAQPRRLPLTINFFLTPPKLDYSRGADTMASESRPSDGWGDPQLSTLSISKKIKPPEFS